MKTKMKFSKQILSVLLCLAMLISYVPMTAYAASSGACGDGVNWTLTDDGVLTISGSGVIPDYRFVNQRPYYSITSQIKEIVIESGVTAIGNLAFSGCENLKKLTIKGDITRIGARAFAQCSAITEITYCGVNAPSDLGTNIWVNGLDISVAVPENYAEGVETFANLSVSRTLPATGGEAETPTYEVKIVGHTTDTGVVVKSIISDGVAAERATHGKDLTVVLEITGEGTVDEVYVRYHSGIGQHGSAGDIQAECPFRRALRNSHLRVLRDVFCPQSRRAVSSEENHAQQHPRVRGVVFYRIQSARNNVSRDGLG